VGVPVLGRTDEEDSFKVGLANDTPGTVFRYSAGSPLKRNLCERLGASAKYSILAMTITNSGVEGSNINTRLAETKRILGVPLFRDR
jgi:hypothetical protein